MRQNARLPPQASRGQGSGIAAPVPAAPLTPRHLHGAGAALNDLIRSLEAEWQLGLQVRDESWSPSTASGSLSEKVYGQIKRLHYSSGPALDKVLQAFQLTAPGFEQSQRLDLLHRTLKSQTKSPISRAGTPMNELARRNGGPKSLLSSQEPARVTRSGLFHTYRQEDPESYYTTAPEPGSPTDDDEDFVTPPSPTLSSRSAQRRIQPSDVSPTQAPARAPSKAPSPPLFKKPSLDMARSFQAGAGSFHAASGVSSMNNSFNANSMWLSQQTQADTVNTSFTSDALNKSFTSDAVGPDVHYPRLTRTSSTTIGSLDDQDLMSVTARLERESTRLEKELGQASQERESSSTFGSIDEDGLVETSFRVEAEDAMPRPNALRSPPVPAFQRADSVRGSPSPTKPSSSRHSVTGPSSPIPLPPRLGPSPRLSPTHAFAQPPAAAVGPSPTRSVTQSPQRPSIESPSRLPHYIRNIPGQNLFVEDIPEELKAFPYFVRFICCRIATGHGISMSELMHGMDIAQVRSDPTVFWEQVKHKVPDATPGDPHKAWSTAAARRDFVGYTFKGRLALSNSGPAFKLELLPIQEDRSCRFQRKFGSDRFLYLNLPPFEASGKRKPSRFTVADMTNVEYQFKLWLEREHSFLGRKWRAFHLEPIKRKRGARSQEEDNSDKRLVMFATEGVDLDPIPLGEMINWFFPFARNMDQSFCKAYARLDLGLSRTIPTLEFMPHQIRFVSDIIADGSAEDSQFNDERLSWRERPAGRPVMNDGCSLISVGAAKEIWRRYSKAVSSIRPEPLPSVFQGRIGGAKGVWMVSDEPSTSDPAHLDIWIEITPSQLKFQSHVEDLADDTPFDPLRLTFEYVNHSSSPGPSELHISFIPILIDRGVSRDTIATLMTERLDAEREQLLQMLPDPAKLYHWIHQESSSSDLNRCQAALPHSLPDKIKRLLESGFYPGQEPYLDNIIFRFIKQAQIWMESKLRVPLGNATFLYGVADPLGILAPGEVHVDFSAPFVDNVTGGTYRALNNMEILVARQPACRQSDIQKVRAVKHPELAHLVDVVVFPTRGEYPLAGKLQGGDYDGDVFWLCWEQALVEPFKNAPAPLHEPDPAQYKISKDSRKLHEVMSHEDLSTIDNLLKEVVEFRMAPSLLGIVTNFLEKQSYYENRVFSPKLVALCDMHDLLVDAPKQGYHLSKKAYENYIRFELKCGKPRVPSYKQAMEDCEGAKELGEAEKARERNYAYKKDNVVDYLYFDVVRKHDVATLKRVKEAFLKDTDDDAALQYPYLQLLRDGSDTVKSELAALADKVRALEREWTTSIASRNFLTSEHYNKTVDTCYNKYRSFMPTTAFHPDTAPWLYPYLHPEFKFWDYLRASTLYTVLPTRHAFVWHMAGRELTDLKARPLPGAKLVVGNIFANLKPKPIKVPKPEEDEKSEDEFQSAMESVQA